MSEPIWSLTKGGLQQLPPFLAKFQRLNEQHNRRLLGERLVRALILLWLQRRGVEI